MTAMRLVHADPRSPARCHGRLAASCCALLPVVLSGDALAHESSAGIDAFRVASIAALLVAGLLYGLALRAGAALRGAHVLAFAAGWSAIAAALLSPIDRVALERFSIHMVQHELLMLVAPPLLILGRPFTALAAVLPRSVVRWAAWPLRIPPLAAWGLHAAALWIWHVPRLFDAATGTAGWHALQHLSFFLTALLFWWTVFRRVRTGMAVLYVLTTLIHSGALAALLTFAPASLYAGTPLAEQQLAGLIMWIPAGFLLLGAGLVAFDRLLQSHA